MPAIAFDYDDMLDILEDGNCALFIGPGLLMDDNGKTLEKAMWKSLEADKKDHPLIRKYYENEGLVLLHEENYRRRLARRMRKFYEGNHLKAAEVLKRISRLPIPLIFNLTSDSLLQKAFENNHVNFHFDFYYKGQPYQPYNTPSTDKPLIYNLLGDLSEPESMVLTHKDLFEYLESIFAGKSMSSDLRKAIQDTNTYIFLGLPFEKWYMQLLLRVLYHISARLEKIEQYASNPQSKDVNAIFEDEFKIKFLPDDGITFIESMYSICDEEGLLRDNKIDPVKKMMEPLDEAKHMIGNNQIEEAIESINAIIQENASIVGDFEKNLILLQSNYIDLSEKINLNMAQESDKVALNGVKHGLLKLIIKLEKSLLP